MDLLASFEALSLVMLTDYVSHRQEENLQLDFKTLSDPSMERGDDKRRLAQMLSAFANSSGGLIVWAWKHGPTTMAWIALSRCRRYRTLRCCSPA